MSESFEAESALCDDYGRAERLAIDYAKALILVSQAAS